MKKIENMTIGELQKEVEDLRKKKATALIYPKGKKRYVIRTYSAGVWTGYIKKRNGKEGIITHARRIWYWDGAASLSQLAREGVKKPENCKFAMVVPEVTLTEIIELIPMTKDAIESIDSVEDWKNE